MALLLNKYILIIKKQLLNNKFKVRVPVMKATIEQEFKGSINGYQIKDKNVFYTAEFIIQNLESAKNIEINGSEFTRDLIETIERINQKADQPEFDNIEKDTYYSITSEQTLKDFRLRCEGYEYYAEDFNKNLILGKYDGVFTAKKEQALADEKAMPKEIKEVTKDWDKTGKSAIERYLKEHFKEHVNTPEKTKELVKLIEDNNQKNMVELLSTGYKVKEMKDASIYMKKGLTAQSAIKIATNPKYSKIKDQLDSLPADVKKSVNLEQTVKKSMSKIGNDKSIKK